MRQSSTVSWHGKPPMTPRLSFSSKQQMLAKPHLMLISPCPWLSASVRITEPVYPTPISREDQGSMSVIACQDLLGKSVKLTLTSASLFHAFEVRRPMLTFSFWEGCGFLFTAVYCTWRRFGILMRRGGGGIGIFGFCYFLDRFFGFWAKKTSVFQFWCSLRFADFPFLGIWFSVFAKNTNGFSDLISDAYFWFLLFDLFGFWFLFDPSGNYAPPLSRITAKRKCYQEECETNQLKYRRDP